jgi:hypothetical protein
VERGRKARDTRKKAADFLNMWQLMLCLKELTISTSQLSVENSVGKVENKLKNKLKFIHCIHEFIYIKMNTKRHKKLPVADVFDNILDSCAHTGIFLDVFFYLLNRIDDR